MKVVFSARFTRDLEAIQDYIAHHNAPAAYRLAQRIRQRVQHLGTHPHMGRPGGIAGTRELVVPGTPYIIYYRVTGQAVQVLRVYHAARRPPSGL